MSKFSFIVGFIITSILIAILIAGYFGYKKLTEDNLKLVNEVIQFKKLTDSLVRSSTTWATKAGVEKSLENLLTKEDLIILREDMKKIGAKLLAVGNTVGTIDKRIAKLEKSDKEGPDKPPIKICSETGETIDVFGYTKKTQIKELNDSNKAPIAIAEFDASKENPWNYEVYQRNYKLITAIGQKDSGLMSFSHKLQYSIPSKDEKKYYSVSLINSEYQQVPNSSKWFWMNPRLDVNFFVGGTIYQFIEGSERSSNILSMGIDLGLSLSSYGETEVDSWFRLFRFGLGYNIERRTGSLSFSPFTFNIGKPLPLLTNLYLTPQIAVDTVGGISINMGIGPQF